MFSCFKNNLVLVSFFKKNSFMSNEEELRKHSQLVVLNGYTVVKQLLSHSFVDRMCTSVMEEFNAQKLAGTLRDRGEKRYQLELMGGKGGWINPEIFENSALIGVLWELLGYDMILASAAAHVAEPGATPQPPHIDFEPLFDQFLPLPPYCIYVHIPLVDTNEVNGAMELWKGSPHMGLAACNVSLANFHTLPLEHLPSSQETLLKGDILIKDMRCFHRGTHNFSTETRPVLSLIFAKKWYRLPYDNYYLRNGYPALSVPRSTISKFPPHLANLFRFCKIVDDQ
jgi:hypothetical protein